MPYDPNNLYEQPRKRYESHTVDPNVLIPANAISEAKLTFLNTNLKMLDRLGIELDQNGRAPMKNGVPSMFIMQKDEQGVEQQVDLAKAGITIGSPDFWYQAQLGNLFAYPAGSKDPVQIGASVHSFRPELFVSKPIKTDEIPEARTADNVNHVYRRPSWFTRAINYLISGYRKRDCEIYRQREALKKTFDAVRRTRTDERMQGEMTEVRAAEARVQDQTDKKELDGVISTLNRDISYKDVGKQVYRDHTAPEPVYHPEYDHDSAYYKKIKEDAEKEGRDNPLTTNHFYRKADFDKLQKINKKIEDYSIGGKPLSQDEYCGLVNAFSLMPKNALSGYKLTPEYDATAVKTIVSLGYDQKRAEEIVSNSCTTMVTTDLMKGDLRGNHGKYLGAAVNPARLDVFDALDQYKQGNKEPLAEAIARGITAITQDTMERDKNIGCNIYNQCDFAKCTVDLLERDPALMKLATEKYGLEEGDMQAVKGLSAMSKADSDRMQAKLKLAKAVQNETVLTEAEKQKCAEEIVLANLMESKMFSENAMEKKKNGDPHKAETQRLLNVAVKNKLVLSAEQTKYYAKHPEERPMPPAGKFYYDQAATLMGGRYGEFNVHPDTIIDLSDEDGVNGMKKIAAEIVKKDGLAMLDTKELNRALVMENNPKYMGTDLVINGMKAISKGKGADAKGNPELNRQNQKGRKNGQQEEELDPLNTGFDLGYLSGPKA